MATITSNGTGGGLWSAGATWNGGAVPVDNDTVVIASGDTVIFNVDTSAWANGINGLTITGTLKVSTSTSSYMKMKAATVIVGAGTFNIGESGAGAIPFAVKHTLTGGAGWYIDGNAGLTMTVYGAEPSIKTIKLSGDEAIGQTELSVDTNITGDIWADGDTIRIDDINRAQESEERVIAAGGRAASTLTITSGLTAAKSTGAIISLITRNVKIIAVGTGTRTIYRVGSTSNKLTVGGGMWTGIPGKNLFETCHYTITTGGSYSASGAVFMTSNYVNISGIVASGNTNVLNQAMIGSIVDSCVMSGNSTAITTSYSITVSNSIISGGSTALNNAIGATLINTTVSGHNDAMNGHGLIASGCTFTNNANSINNSNRVSFVSCSFSGNATDVNRITGNFNNCTFGSTMEFSKYTELYTSGVDNCQSLDHDGNAGALKAWCRGGVVTSQTSTKPTGYVQAYTHALESATYPCFWYKTFTVAAGESVSVEVQLRKTASMAYLPRVYLMNSIENPIADPTQAEDSFTMTDSTDTWESDTFSIDNSAGTTDKDYTLWFLAKNASGNVYSAYDITTQGGGTSSVKILPFTGKVGL